MNEIKVGNKIKRLRQEKGWTQEKLAHESGIAFASLNKIENGNVTPQESTLRCIAEALETTVKALKGE